MVRAVALDNYQGVDLDMADWSVLPPDTRIQAFNHRSWGPDAVVKRLKDFQAVAAMRGLTPVRRDLPEYLPNLCLPGYHGNEKRLHRPGRGC